MTGAPIYLVSACTSGEEFVAAFRRYADKTGLFVPIRDPLPPGGRSRFAVTLKDGGVMIEGEAEIISAARTASVLHGRVGMTLRFLEPDAASKTTLGELEKARLAMRPAPPSIAPRPAAIPAEPRPVPPPVQGRIDAVNALAECVAIGDTSALGPPLPPAPAGSLPKAGPRFVVPAVPATGLGVAPRTSAPPRPLTGPMPMVRATPDARDAPKTARDTVDERQDVRPPSITPRATPQLEALRKDHEPRSDPAQAPAVPKISGFSQTMTAVASAPPPPPPPAPVPAPPAGPTSDTIIAATPPAPAPPPSVTPSTPGDPPVPAPVAPGSDLITTAVPVASNTAGPAAPRRAMEMPAAVPRAITRPGTPAPLPSAPRDRSISTTMTAVPVPAPSSTRQSAPTEIGSPIVEPLPPLEPAPKPRSDSAIEIVASTPAEDDASARTQIHAGAPRPEPSAPMPAVRTPPHGLTPVPPIVATARPRVPEVEIAEPTDLWVGPPEPEPALDPDGSTSPEASSPEPAAALEEAISPEGSASPEESMPSGAVGSRPRRTVIGVVVTPPGVTVLPAAPKTQITDAVIPDDDDAGEPSSLIDRSVLASEEPTGADRAAIGDSAVDPAMPAPAMPAPAMPAPAMSAPATPAPLVPAAHATVPAAPEPVPARGDWIMPTARLAGLTAAGADPVTPAPPAVRPGLPSGDWTIALDPQAPDGWSEPFQLVSPSQLGDQPPPVATPAVVANARQLDSPPRLPTPRPDEILTTEPKVQIDPTLIEPLGRAMPSDGPLRPMPSDGPSRPVPPEEPFRNTSASSQDMPSYGAPPAAIAIEAPPMNAMMAVSQPPFMHPHGQPLMHPGQAPVYPMDGSYQITPMGMSPPLPLTAGGSGNRLADPRYPAYRVQSGRRRAIIVILSALVAVVIGIVVLLVLGASRDRGPADSGSDQRAVPPVHAPQSSAITPDPTHPVPLPSAGSPAAPGDTATKTTAPPAGTTAPPAATAALTCYADVTSQPPGAEIVIDDTNVLGTTPQKIELPCGGPTVVVIRKARMTPATRTVTPTPEGVMVKAVLLKQTFLVKVSSTPAGATVTVNGKSLGVTPTTVKVPAFESSTLTLTKDGYATETEKVAPKTGGLSVHSVLKKLDARKPR